MTLGSDDSLAAIVRVPPDENEEESGAEAPAVPDDSTGEASATDSSQPESSDDS